MTLQNQEAEHTIRKEIFRKAIHLCSAFLPFLFDRFFVLTIVLLVVVLFLYIVFEFVRLHGKKIPIVSFVTEFASRSRDENKFVLGPVTLVAGIILCAILYESSARTVGIYALGFGDGLASLFGKLFGKKQIPFTNGKTIVGSVSCFVAVFVSSFCVCKNFFVSLVCALVGMCVEILPLKDFDNLFIPVLIGGIAKFLLP